MYWLTIFPEKIAREDIIYFPYLRFKGNIFSCQGHEIGYKVLDTTYQGITYKSAPSVAWASSSGNEGRYGK